MPRPKALGNSAAAIVASSTTYLARSQQVLFDVVILIQKGDKDAAITALQRISANNMAAYNALVLLSANEIHEAEQALLDQRNPL